MKTTPLYFLIFYITICFHCAAQNKVSTDCIIAGEILNLGLDPGLFEIKVLNDDAVHPSTQFLKAHLSKGGAFRFQFEKCFASDVFMEYGNKLFRVFIGPEDSVYVKVDAQNKNNTTEFSGSNKILNEEINLFDSEVNGNREIQVNYSKIKDLNPEDYLLYLKSTRDIRTTILNDEMLQKDCSPEFIKWANFEINYSFARGLFHYAWFNPFINPTGKRIFKVIDIPKSFYQAIKDIPINNKEAIINSSYLGFIREYSLTTTDYHSMVFKETQDSSSSFARSDSFAMAFEDLLGTISIHYDGLAKEILLAEKLYGILDPYRRLDVFNDLYSQYKLNIRDEWKAVLEEKYSEVEEE